jgi:hypothetical protein
MDSWSQSSKQKKCRMQRCWDESVYKECKDASMTGAESGEEHTKYAHSTVSACE